MTTGLRAISKRAYEIEDSIEAIQQYSYNYNLKITGIPQKPGETVLQSSEICVKLFQKIGAWQCNPTGYRYCASNTEALR